MRDEEQDPEETISSPQSLMSALEYLYVEAMVSGFYFPAHLILVAALSIEDAEQQRSESDDPEDSRKSRRDRLQKLQLVHSADPRKPATPRKVEGK